MRLPIEFKNNRILLAGIGGGYDILGTVPLWLELKEKNEIFFSNYQIEKTGPFLIEASKVEKGPEKKFKELLESTKINSPVYLLPRSGIKILHSCYKEIIEKHKINVVIAVDSGVDSLMFGDEENSGTLLEDTANIYAIHEVVSLKNNLENTICMYLTCLGFGTENEENLNHYQVLQNMATLNDNFKGCCALSSLDHTFQKYEKICEHLWENERKSHIHTKVISAVRGKFGNNNLYEGIDSRTVKGEAEQFINPLMGIYWWYDLMGIPLMSKLIEFIKNTNTHTDMLMAYRQFLNSQNEKRPKISIPL